MKVVAHDPLVVADVTFPVFGRSKDSSALRVPTTRGDFATVTTTTCSKEVPAGFVAYR
jgi:hypothetical protein